jgi:hypothetical protein
LVRWIQRRDEGEVEDYGAFVIASPYIGIEESEGHEVPEGVEGVEDIIITECIVSILDSEVIQNIPSICHYDDEKVRIGFPYPSRIEIEVPFYNSEKLKPEEYKVAVIYYKGREEGYETILETRPTDFETLRKVVALALF